jgi:hypothetical protein
MAEMNSDDSGIGREIPEPVKRQLRQEVRFACPVPGCGNPLLEYHHFDPPWNQQHHHNLAGMISLCTRHHPMADRGTWTKEQLREFKSKPADVGLIRQTFMWSERSALLQLGNLFTKGGDRVLTVQDERVVGFDKSPDARLLFSLDLRDQKGRSVVLVKENSLSLDVSPLWDLRIDTGATHLKLWHRPKDIGLELRFQRLTMGELEDKVRRLGQVVSGFHDLAIACVDSEGRIPIVQVNRARFPTPHGMIKVGPGTLNIPGFPLAMNTVHVCADGFAFK